MAARKMTEIKVTVKNQVGELARVLGLATQAGVNIIAFCGYGRAGGGMGGEILVVPDKPDKMEAALQKEHISFESNPVVAITGAAGKGMGAQMAGKFAKAAINILHSYASTTGSGNSTTIFRVEKPDVALKVLKT
jgi:hypothetical protein